MKKSLFIFLFGLLLLVLLTACETQASPVITEVDVAPADTQAVSTDTPVYESPTPPPLEETPTASPTVTPEPTEPEMPVAMPAEPQRIEFQTEDGTNLVGLYYPASNNPAPLVVLMHWARGDKSNWTRLGMVQWLTNRGMSLDEDGISQAEFEKTYPAMPEGVSFGVFIFDFRNFGESDRAENWNPEGWRMDAQAAVQTAQLLPGVDTTKIATLGSSIGADGSVLGCLVGCSAVISLSPGNYLDINYADAVFELEMMGVPVRCIAAEGDGEAAPTCRNAFSSLYEFVIYPDDAHGNNLLTPGRDPDIGQTIQDFLFQVFDIN